MDDYLAEIEVIEWFRMARARSERATLLASARTEGDVESAQRTHATSRNTDLDLPNATPHVLRAGRSIVRFLKDLTLKQGERYATSDTHLPQKW